MKKIIASIVTLLLAAVIVVTVGIGSAWFTNWNVKTWFNSWGKDKNVPAQAFENDEAGVQISKNQNNGVYFTSETIAPASYSLYGVPKKADSAKLVTATAYPADTVVTFEWSVEWVTSTIDTVDHTTSMVVTDYVTVTPLTDGSNQATVTCLKPFPYRIMIKAKVREGNSNGICFVDYEKKVESAVLTFSPSRGSVSMLTCNMVNDTMHEKITMPLTEEFTIQGEWNYSFSTVDPEWLPESIDFLLRFNRTVFNEMKADGINLDGFILYESYPGEATRRLSDLIIHMGEDGIPDGKTIADYPELLRSVATWLSQHLDKAICDISVLDDSGRYQSNYYPIYLTAESFTQVSNVEMSDSSVIF